jgi:hypothetical protein
MRRHLPAHFYSALEIHSPLKGPAIHAAVIELVEFYHVQLEMVFPALNYPLLIYKHMRDMALPSNSPILVGRDNADQSQLKYILPSDVLPRF